MHSVLPQEELEMVPCQDAQAQDSESSSQRAAPVLTQKVEGSSPGAVVATLEQVSWTSDQTGLMSLLVTEWSRGDSLAGAALSC